MREDRGGDATSEKAAGESESDVRARVGGEEQEPRGDGDGSKGDDAATRGPPRRPRTPSRGRQRGRSAGRRCRAGGGGGRRRARRRRLPVALRRRLPRRWPWRWPHWQRLHLPRPQLPLLPWSKENGNREEKNAMRTRIQKRELTIKTHTCRCRGRLPATSPAAPLAFRCYSGCASRRNNFNGWRGRGKQKRRRRRID